MGELRTRLDWKGGLRFEGTGLFGHTIVTDGARKAGGNESGHKPTELLLWAIASCTGVDVVRILQKQRQELTSLEIEVTATHGDDYPKPFHTIEVKFVARGRNLDPNKLAQAIELSHNKYCTVSQTLMNETAVVTSFEVLD